MVEDELPQLASKDGGLEPEHLVADIGVLEEVVEVQKVQLVGVLFHDQVRDGSDDLRWSTEGRYVVHPYAQLVVGLRVILCLVQESALGVLVVGHLGRHRGEHGNVVGAGTKAVIGQLDVEINEVLDVILAAGEVEPGVPVALDEHVLVRGGIVLEERRVEHVSGLEGVELDPDPILGLHLVPVVVVEGLVDASLIDSRSGYIRVLGGVVHVGQLRRFPLHPDVVVARVVPGVDLHVVSAVVEGGRTDVLRVLVRVTVGVDEVGMIVPEAAVQQVEPSGSRHTAEHVHVEVGELLCIGPLGHVEVDDLVPEAGLGVMWLVGLQLDLVPVRVVGVPVEVHVLDPGLREGGDLLGMDSEPVGDWQAIGVVHALDLYEEPSFVCGEDREWFDRFVGGR